MIIKIAGSWEGSWSYYECDTVHSHLRNLKDIKHVLGESLVYLANPNRTKNLKMVFFNKIKEEQKTIITDKVIYLLNNEGKTIDKI